MNLCRAKPLSQSGILLLDLMVYMALIGIVLALAAVVFNQLLLQTGNLRRNISDIERALKAGERWREDIRAATGPVRSETIENAVTIIIPHGTNEISYALGNPIRRKSPGSTAWEIALTGVKSAQITPEKRTHASGWRWEVELEQRRKNARVRPLFTFLAVPAQL